MTHQILGISFFAGIVDDAVKTMCGHGGMVVVPAAPALVNIQYDEVYRDALVRSDLAIADSGFMVLLWKLLQRQTIRRISGLAYLQRLLEVPQLRQPGASFFVVSSETAREKALPWSRGRGFLIGNDDFYVAPRYSSEVVDARLAEIVNARRPAHIVIGLGGGVQEKLGLYLRDAVTYRPAIHCIGAALGFLTGDQKPIPDWADRLYLGWLLRLARNPRLYFRRFWAAHELPGLIMRYATDLPPLRTGVRIPSRSSVPRAECPRE